MNGIRLAPAVRVFPLGAIAGDVIGSVHECAGPHGGNGYRSRYE